MGTVVFFSSCQQSARNWIFPLVTKLWHRFATWSGLHSSEGVNVGFSKSPLNVHRAVPHPGDCGPTVKAWSLPQPGQWNQY